MAVCSCDCDGRRQLRSSCPSREPAWDAVLAAGEGVAPGGETGPERRRDGAADDVEDIGQARQQYAIEAEAAQMEAFAEGRPLPRDPAVERSMEVIRQAGAAGTRVYRVHVVDLPLTPYLRYEMAAYRENLAAGEEVFIAARPWHRDRAGVMEDFVLFDPGAGRQAVVGMRYDADGRNTGRERSDAPADIARARLVRDLAMTHAVPLDQFATAAEPG
jgi:hypothetical protein